MRLLSTHDLSFWEPVVRDRPYAILSHVWETEEVTFKEMKKQLPALKQKVGYIKMHECAKRCKELEYDYFWIDTCCIDKRSSAELSLSINSMFKWYSEAEVCLVYLFDVHNLGGKSSDEWTKTDIAHFSESRWFRRGWTLQELVAPPKVIFFDSKWVRLQDSKLVADAITSKTRIPKELFWRPGEDSNDTRMMTRDRIDRYSVAQKMSWAAGRETTVEEDTAYCLLGIFDINMPLLYGEGEKSFRRLQEEIIRYSNDRTLFMWRDPQGDEFSYRGLLAKSAHEFADCGQCTMNPLTSWQVSQSVPYEMTHQGVKMSMGIERLTQSLRIRYGIPESKSSADLYLVSFWGVLSQGRPASIVLERLQTQGRHFSRVLTNMTPNLRDDYHRSVELESLFFVRPPVRNYVEMSYPSIYAFSFLSSTTSQNNERLETRETIRSTQCSQGQFVTIQLNSVLTGNQYWVLLGFFASDNMPIRLKVVSSEEGDVVKALEQGASVALGKPYYTDDIVPLSISCELRMQDERVICLVMLREAVDVDGHGNII